MEPPNKLISESLQTTAPSFLTSFVKNETWDTHHASPQGTLVADAFLAGPAENTQLLVVVFTPAETREPSRTCFCKRLEFHIVTALPFFK